jgi:hypothetical protein
MRGEHTNEDGERHIPAEEKNDDPKQNAQRQDVKEPRGVDEYEKDLGHTEGGHTKED